jgi:hypothetical protein
MKNFKGKTCACEVAHCPEILQEEPLIQFQRWDTHGPLQIG